MTQTALITGATAGIGQATAELLAQKGFNLILTGRRAERLEALKNELLAKHQIEIHTLCFDIQNFESCQAAWSSLNVETQNSITVLINNAGLASGRSPIHEGDVSDWDKMIDTNVKGLLYITRLVVPILKEKLSGHIVNIASIAGKEVYQNGNVYCASKHAVDALSRSMRIDLLPYNIKVTNVAPGAAETEFSLVRLKGDEAAAKSVYDGFDPLVAEDIAETIWFALSRPAHVNINDLVIVPTAQANVTNLVRK
jgi:3-hydroxy acid dehydrogenase / malonic semialdehyde reductase